MTEQEKLKIAEEVIRGERPKSDLGKYGISLGQKKQISAHEFQRLLAKEQSTTPRQAD